MLLDLYTLKSGLTALLPSPAPAGFVKRVNSIFTKVDCLLKTVQVRPSPPEALVQAYLLHIADRNEANFRRMLEIKGIRSKQEQSQLVELFNLHRASDRHAPNLQQSNPLFSSFQSSSASASGPGTGSTVSQGLSTLGTTATTSIGTPGRFDPTMLGSAIISAAKDGVERFPLGSGVTTGAGNPLSSSHTGSGPTSPGPGLAGQRVTSETFEASNAATPASATTQLNENLKNIGKFFRRDLGGFGGRFGRSAEDSAR
jgi:vacuolar protein sorting-associated protein 53